MDLDVDTFLTTVYCVCDDLYRAEIAPTLARRPGAKGKLADREVLALAALAQWHPHRCERCFLRYAHRHWRPYFPKLTSQSAFNRRVRQLWAVLCRLGPALAEQLAQGGETPAAYEVWDGVPIPLMRRCRGRRQHRFGLAASVGCGGSDQEWDYGLHALVVVRADGPISGFVLGPAATSEYWLAEALLRWRDDPSAPSPTLDDLALALGPSHKAGAARAGPTGPLGPRWGVGQPSGRPCVSDLGCSGRAWRAHWRTAYGATILTKADYRALADPAERQAWSTWLCGLRQQAETTFNTLSDQFGVKFPRARDLWGVWTRFAAKVLAFNLMVVLNHRFGRSTFQIFNPIT
jgi:hypothetical protein